MNGLRTHGALRPAGVLITSPHDGCGEIHQDTIQCAHCGRHWVHRPGSGKTRGFCFKCSGLVCGNPRCVAKCVPAEQRIENLEQGRDWDYTPVRVPVKIELA